MARKKKEEAAAAGSPAWMATFSDLMNLLLCFFVLLFAFSSVDAEKFAELVASLNDTYQVSIFNNGASAIGEGKLVSQGVSQLDNMSEYYSENGMEAGQDSEVGESEQGKDEENDSPDQKAIEKYKEEQVKQQKEKTEAVYEEVVEAAEEKKLQDEIMVTMDEGYQFVQISMSGAILFDSGSDNFQKESLPILNKLGTILKTYDQYQIKIEGHTDNVPISNNDFKSNMWLSTARATKVFEYLTQNTKMNPKTLEASGRGEFEPIASNNTAEGRTKNRRVEIKIYTDTNN